jgi:hypothetical protein
MRFFGRLLEGEQPLLAGFFLSIGRKQARDHRTVHRLCHRDARAVAGDGLKLPHVDGFGGHGSAGPREACFRLDELDLRVNLGVAGLPNKIRTGCGEWAECGYRGDLLIPLWPSLRVCKQGPDFRGRRVDFDFKVGDVGRALVDFAFLGKLIEGGEARAAAGDSGESYGESKGEAFEGANLHGRELSAQAVVRASGLVSNAGGR